MVSISMANAIVLLILFINSWIYSYQKDEKHSNNTLSYEDCVFFIQYHNLVGCAVGMIIAIPVGKYADKIEPKYTLPFAFLQCSICYLLIWLSVPGGWLYYISGPMLHIAMTIKLIIVKSYAFRMFPVEVRSSLISNIGIL